MRVLKLLFLFLSLNVNVMAQQGFDVQKEITIDVSADQLWEMIGPGFVEVYKWSSNVDHAEGQGQGQFEGAICDERFCDVNVKGFSKISEKLTWYDEEVMGLTYEVFEGMPSFVTTAANTWKVVPINEHSSKLSMLAKFRSKGIMGKLMNGMMKSKMNKTLETVLQDAKVYAETGQVSIAKKERMNKLAKANRVGV